MARVFVRQLLDVEIQNKRKHEYIISELSFASVSKRVHAIFFYENEFDLHEILTYR